MNKKLLLLLAISPLAIASNVATYHSVESSEKKFTHKIKVDIKENGVIVGSEIGINKNIYGYINAGYDNDKFGVIARYDISKFLSIQGIYKHRLNDKMYLKNNLILKTSLNSVSFSDVLPIDLKEYINGVENGNADNSFNSKGLSYSLIYGIKHKDKIDFISDISFDTSLVEMNNNKLANFRIYGLNSKLEYKPIQSLRSNTELELKIIRGKIADGDININKFGIKEKLEYDILQKNGFTLTPGLDFGYTGYYAKAQAGEGNSDDNKHYILINPNINLKYKYENVSTGLKLELPIKEKNATVVGTISLGYSW